MDELSGSTEIMGGLNCGWPGRLLELMLVQAEYFVMDLLVMKLFNCLMCHLPSH